MFVSFSGGKDSTVTADLVSKAFSTNKVKHIFGDTTLEFPLTYEYRNRFAKTHTVLRAKNYEKNFEELCEQIGPPSRVMRWCCTVFKTGAITKTLSQVFKDKTNVLTFYGIRKSESASRSKYDRETLDHDMLDPFIAKVVVKQDREFEWYINLSGQDLFSTKAIVEGRKKKATVSIDGGGKSFFVLAT